MKQVAGLSLHGATVHGAHLKAQSQTGLSEMQFDEHMGLTQGFIRQEPMSKINFPSQQLMD